MEAVFKLYLIVNILDIVQQINNIKKTIPIEKRLFSLKRTKSPELAISSLIEILLSIMLKNSLRLESCIISIIKLSTTKIERISKSLLFL